MTHLNESSDDEITPIYINEMEKYISQFNTQKDIIKEKKRLFNLYLSISKQIMQISYLKYCHGNNMTKKLIHPDNYNNLHQSFNTLIIKYKNNTSNINSGSTLNYPQISQTYINEVYIIRRNLEKTLYNEVPTYLHDLLEDIIDSFHIYYNNCGQIWVISIYDNDTKKWNQSSIKEVGSILLDELDILICCLSNKHIKLIHEQDLLQDNKLINPFDEFI